MRIRSAALADAISHGEVVVLHQPGSRLLADALTKLLPIGPLMRFKVGMGMVPFGQKNISVKSVSITSGNGVLLVKRCLYLTIVSTRIGLW